MKYYLTTPIYYVNDLPHVGHAYTTVAADVLARWRRLNGDDVFFLTGTDEHGAKIVQAAEKAGLTPRAFCDQVSAGFRADWEALGITNDGFIRTTDPAHERGVREFLTRLHASGAIYRAPYEGSYCVACEKFLSSGDLDADGCCPDHRQKPVAHAEENYFFRLSAYRDRLIAALSDTGGPEHIEILPVEKRNELLGKLRAGLEDISISRAALAWGIPLPFDTSQTAYVWVDALLNYITGVGFGSSEETLARRWPAEAHLMAKDILWFHGVIWPAMLMAAGLPLPKRLFAHGFFTIAGQKMSKTLGNIIRPADMITRYGRDAARYLLVSLFPFGADGDISWQSMDERYNVDLANNLGNLAARSLSMAEKYAQGRIAAPPEAATLEQTLALLKPAGPALDAFDLYASVAAIRSAVDHANRAIETAAPWKMAASSDPRLPAVLASLVTRLRLIAAFCTPFMPETAQRIWESSGGAGMVEKAAAALLAGDTSAMVPGPATTVVKGPNLFPRIA